MIPNNQSIAARIADINKAIAELRALTIDPFSLRVGAEVDIELYPEKESERVLVARRGLGRTLVNYTSEGLILDVFGEEEIEPIHSAALHASDLEVLDDHDNYAAQVAFRNVFAELSAAKSVSGSSAALQVPNVRHDLLTKAVSGVGIEPEQVVLRLVSPNDMEVPVTAQMLQDASPMGERGWLLPSGFELWFEPLQQFTLLLIENPDRPEKDLPPIAQNYWAEDLAHAKEQAENAYPGCLVL